MLLDISTVIRYTVTHRYDTYHDSARRGESVGALVASVNDTFTKYFSTVDFHKDRTEMSNQIGVSYQYMTCSATFNFTQR